MIFFSDCHCDTLGVFDDADFFGNGELSNISYKRLRQGNVGLQTFAVCVPDADGKRSYERGMGLISAYKRMTSYEGILSITGRSSLTQCTDRHVLGALLALEGCDMLGGEPDGIYELYNMGVRMLSLTWNNSNPFSGGISENKEGLSDKGKELLKICEEIGILVDTSHISQRGFWDIAERATRPFVATHSNAKHICKNKRNLDNGQLLEIRDSGGCVGINFYPPFLNDSGSASADDVIRHIEYMAGLIGTRHVAIGSDFDGVDNNLPRGICGPQDLCKIAEALLRLNYTEEDTEDICGKNLIRVLNDVLK